MILQSQMPLKRIQNAVRKGYQCGECGNLLTIAWGGAYGVLEDVLMCPGHPEHRSVAREAALSTWDTPDEYNPYSYTLSRIRREKLEKTLGIEKARSLAPMAGRGSLTRQQAIEIVKTIWPNAPEVEVVKASMICEAYGLNPLMKHLYLLPFQHKENQGGKWVVTRTDWAVVMGIKASRIIARRRGDYAYLDDTPRRMNDDEQMKILGEVDKANIWAITKLRDNKGNTAQGIGSWPAGSPVYGADKGNSKLNMAIIRSERNALDRLFPDSLPQEVEVRDERFDPPIQVVDLGTGEILSGGNGAALPEPPQQPPAVEGTVTGQPAGDAPTDSQSDATASQPPLSEPVADPEVLRQKLYKLWGRNATTERQKFIQTFEVDPQIASAVVLQKALDAAAKK